MDSPEVVNSLVDAVVVVILTTNGGGDHPEKDILSL